MYLRTKRLLFHPSTHWLPQVSRIEEIPREVRQQALKELDESETIQEMLESGALAAAASVVTRRKDGEQRKKKAKTVVRNPSEFSGFQWRGAHPFWSSNDNALTMCGIPLLLINSGLWQTFICSGDGLCLEDRVANHPHRPRTRAWREEGEDSFHCVLIECGC